MELKEKNKIKTPLEKKMYDYICYCDKVTKGDIVTAIFGGAKTLKEVMAITGAMKIQIVRKKIRKVSVVEMI